MYELVTVRTEHTDHKEETKENPPQVKKSCFQGRSYVRHCREDVDSRMGCFFGGMFIIGSIALFCMRTFSPIDDHSFDKNTTDIQPINVGENVVGSIFLLFFCCMGMTLCIFIHRRIKNAMKNERMPLIS